MVDDLDLLSGVVAAVLAAADVNVVAACNTRANADAVRMGPDRVRPARFVPFAQVVYDDAP